MIKNFKELDKKMKMSIITAIALLIIVVVGTTYGFFSASISGSEGAISVTTATIGNVTFVADHVTPASTIYPGWNSDYKTITISQGQADVSIDYNCDLSIVENSINDLKLRFESDDVTVNHNYNFFTSVGLANSNSITIPIASGTLNSNDSHEIRFAFKFPETGSNQNYDQTKSFEGYISCHIENGGVFYSETFPGAINRAGQMVGGALPATTAALLNNSPVIGTRTGFDVFENQNVDIFSTLQDENGDGVSHQIYYYAGEYAINWLKFGNASSCIYNDDSSVEIFEEIEEGNVQKLDQTACEEITEFCYSPDNNVGYIGFDEMECDEFFSGTWTYGEATFNSNAYDLYWRIMRTNENGGVRLLYVGQLPVQTSLASGYQEMDYSQMASFYNLDYLDSGYMFNGNGLENDTSSSAKTFLDLWYYNTFNNDFDSYVDKQSIYCNDRSMFNASTYNVRKRVDDLTPTLSCVNLSDRFSASSSNGGNGLLLNEFDEKSPIALPTVDEMIFVGANIIDIWGNDLYDTSGVYLMSPESEEYVYVLFGGRVPDTYYTTDSLLYVRPVISLKPCVALTGNGTLNNPYQVGTIDSSCANSFE